MPGHILASGGSSLGGPFDDLVLELGGPRLCFVPTASSAPEARLISFYDSFARRAASAGMICWFEAGVTDSFGPELAAMRDLLGFLPGSACPHYDSEERRRVVYRELVDSGFPPGYAVDHGAALHFVGTELHEAVTMQEGANAYRIEPEIETPLEMRVS